jgi:hypothetical protein
LPATDLDFNSEFFCCYEKKEHPVPLFQTPNQYDKLKFITRLIEKGGSQNMASKAPVFEKIYQDYLARVAGLDLTKKQDMLGIRVDGQTITIPFFNETLR